MARTPLRRRIVGLGALTLPLLLAAGLTTQSCASDRQEDKGPAIKNVKQLVYAVRQATYQQADGTWAVDVAGGMGQVLDYLRYVPGGRLEILDLATNDVENVNQVLAEDL